LTLVLLPQAQRDLDAIVDPLLSRILKRLRMLERFPALGAPMLGPFDGYRSTVVAMFRVVYRVLPTSTIEVAYVRHCRRRPPA
jgi:plasmid stabilization system protein ParE